MPDAVLAFVA